jgi:hypothetical protein
VLNEAGVVLLFRDKVYLQPDKVSIAPTRFPHLLADVSVNFILRSE